MIYSQSLLQPGQIRATAEDSNLGNLTNYSRIPRPSSSSTTTTTTQQRGGSDAQPRVLPYFWVPAYLEGSRYAQKLRKHWIERRRAIRESEAVSRDDKIVPGYRGMAYDVVESKPSSLDDDRVPPMPSMWNARDKHSTLEILGAGTEIRYSANGPSTSPQLESATVRADYAMPPRCGIYYYEIRIRSKPKECSVAIGFAQRAFSLERLPGWEANSWAFHSDDGRAFIGSQNGQQYHKPFGENDVIGCGVDFYKNQVFFTKNGQDLHVAFRDVLPSAEAIFPCVGVKKHSTVQISTNFGQQEFLFDIRSRMEKAENEIRRQILTTDTSALHPDQTVTAFTQELIAQYLSHAGFIETAGAFAAQVQQERKILYGETSNLPDLQNPETNDARPRQQIRAAIQKGDIDSALALIESHFPDVLVKHPQILFRLKCCKFLELVKKATTSERSRRKRSSNGVASSHTDIDRQPPSTQAARTTTTTTAQLSQPPHSDEQATTPPPSTTDIDMTLTDADIDIDTDHSPSSPSPSPPSTPDPEQTALDSSLLTYGRHLTQTYSASTPDYTTPLSELQSLIAYWNPSTSPHGALLNAGGRTQLAEDVNARVLEGLGRDASAVLERAVRGTEEGVEVLAETGGAASLVPVVGRVRRSLGEERE